MNPVQDISINKEKTFWFFQISGWTIFFFQHVFIFNPIKHFTFQNVLLRIVVLIIGFLLSVGLRSRLKKIDFLKYSFLSLSVIIFISSFICSSVWYISEVIISKFFEVHIPSFEIITFTNLVVGIIRDQMVFISWCGLYFGIKFWMEWVSQKEKTDNALLITRNTQLEMLRYQLNPHFLFNTFSTLRAIISEENVKAKEIITKISEFLRYTLTDIENNVVPLSKEIEVIKNYLDIEKVRFEDELIVQFDIDNLAEDFPIPIFLIHPLVENSIKHGMQTSPIPLKVFISAKVQDSFLTISVLNTGSWIERSIGNHNGRGLENIKKRLEIYSPNHSHFQVLKNNDSVEVKMSLYKETIK